MTLLVYLSSSFLLRFFLLSNLDNRFHETSGNDNVLPPFVVLLYCNALCSVEHCSYAGSCGNIRVAAVDVQYLVPERLFLSVRKKCFFVISHLRGERDPVKMSMNIFYAFWIWQRLIMTKVSSPCLTNYCPCILSSAVFSRTQIKSSATNPDTGDPRGFSLVSS